VIVQPVNLELIAEEADLTWELSPDLRREFCSKDDYVAYCKARAQGRFRVARSVCINGSQEVKPPQQPDELGRARLHLTAEQPAHCGPVRVIFSGALRGRIAGYGAVYGTLNRKSSKLEHGAFRDSLQTPLPMLWGHDTDKPIGSWHLLREDSYGLWAEGQINAGVSAGRDALELVRAADVTGLSVGFMAKPGGWERKEGITTFKSADLFEISVVPVPAESLARITERMGV
jgi:HK97 family phage prohead protease